MALDKAPVDGAVAVPTHTCRIDGSYDCLACEAELPTAECPHHTLTEWATVTPGWVCPFECGAFVQDALR